MCNMNKENKRKAAEHDQRLDEQHDDPRLEQHDDPGLEQHALLTSNPYATLFCHNDKIWLQQGCYRNHLHFRLR